MNPATRQFQGRRVYPDEDGGLSLEPGDYGKLGDTWYARAPGDPNESLTSNLSNHEVTEHEDGTISVNPSILITGYDNDCKIQWHGWLKRGMWQEA